MAQIAQLHSPAAGDTVDPDHYNEDIQQLIGTVNALEAANIATGAVGTTQLADGAATTAKIGNLQVTTAKLAADAVNGTKIADDAINSEHYADGSIDPAHLADNAVTPAKTSTGLLQEKISTYSGDNGATQGITGVGFQPTSVAAFAQDNGTLDYTIKTSSDGVNAAIVQRRVYGADHIISLDADGFTVGDGTGLGNVLNRNGITYTS